MAEPVGGLLPLGRDAADVRERLDGLLDPDSFVELASGGAAGGGVVVGVGAIGGRDVAVYALEPAALDASRGEVIARKIAGVQDLALRDRVPLVGLHDPGGPRVEGGIAALAGWADVLSHSVRSSGVIPQVSAVAEACTGVAAWAPALADFVFATAEAGSPLATGPDVHFLAADEAECLEGVRRLLSHLPSHCAEAPPFLPTADPPERADVELQHLVPEEADVPYDMRDVVARVLDDGRFLEVQRLFAENLLAGFGRLGGYVVGVVANQPNVLDGAVDGPAATKAARFVRFCDAFNVPLVSLVDARGGAPGTAREQAELARHGARLVYAYAEATVPKLVVAVRRAYGAAYVAMSPRQLGADLSLAWPTAQVAVSDPGAGPYAAAERGYVDDVIEPRQTRRQLIRGLRLCQGKTVERPPRKHGNIPL